MAVFYKLYKDNRKTGKSTGKWYARATMVGVVNLDRLAEEMQSNCTVKKSDIKAVLTELVETMKRALQDGKKVKLDGLGSFKIGIHGLGAETAKEYLPAKNITSLSLNFTPELHVSADRKYSTTFLSGVSVQEASTYEDFKKADKATTQTGTEG